LIGHLLKIRDMPIGQAVEALRRQNLLHSALNCKEGVFKKRPKGRVEVEMYEYDV